VASKAVDSGTEKRYLERGAVILVASIIGGFVADYTMNVVLSRLLPAHEYGDIRVAQAFALIAGIAVLLGGDRATLRFLPGHAARRDGVAVWEYLWLFGRIGLCLSLVLIASLGLATFLHIGEFDPEHHHPYLRFSLLVPLVAGGALLSRLLQSDKRLAASNWPGRIWVPGMIIAFVLSANAVFGPVTVNHVIVSMALALLLVGGWQWFRARQLGLIRLGRSQGRFPLGATLRVSVPMVLVVLVGIAMSQVDLFMLEALGDETEVGYYAAGASTAHVVIIPQLTITALFAPLIAPALEAGPLAARRLFWTAQRPIVIVVVPITLGLLLFGGTLLSLFGEQFLNAVTALRILAVAYLCWSLGALSSTWLQYSGRGPTMAIISAIALAINVVANYVLIQRYGLNGAAAATALAMTCAAGAVLVAHVRFSRSDACVRDAR
jgi:O-antigen/teichoic acid export membrane protein